MLKRIVNLPFRVLGRAARAVQEHEANSGRAPTATSVSEPISAASANVPDLSVPDDFQTTKMALSATEFRRMQTSDAALEFLDVRPSGSTPLSVEALQIAESQLGIELAELPPAGQPIIVIADSSESARRVTRFLRFRGIEDAVFLADGAELLKRT